MGCFDTPFSRSTTPIPRPSQIPIRGRCGKGASPLMNKIQLHRGATEPSKPSRMNVVRPNRPSIRKAFHFAWKVYKEHVGLFTACMSTFFAAWVVLEIIVIAGQRFGALLWVTAHLSFFILFAGMEVGFIQICLALHDGKQVRYSDNFRELRFGVNFFFVQLAYFATVLVGLALLIVPGSYLGTRYTFYAFSFADGNPNLKQSFKQSAVTSHDSMWLLFWFSILILLFNIAGAGILGIGLIMTVPLSTLMKVNIYRQLKG
jgi:uncharacterized membrane protein